jgi:uncharacterized repeat protein (TIGR01451 family)
MRSRLVYLAVLVVSIGLLAVAAAPASSPPSSTITAPSTLGGTATDAWTGTIPPGANPKSNCTSGLSPVDHHMVHLNAPASYGTLSVKFEFSITWKPNTPTGDTADEILTVVGPSGEVGSSDGGTTTERVTAYNLASGDYDVMACGFANAVPQDYAGKLEITAAAGEPSLPSAPAQGLQFSAAVPADNQRDESEPLIEIDKVGNTYACGPTGFSNASDYAQVSTDGGDQYHLLGSPPRGQQGAGGGGDCGLATGISTNAQGNYQYAYTGLGPLTGFVTSSSPNNGHNLTTGGPFGNGVTDQGGGADRQWMTFTDDHTVLLSYNQQAPRNVVVQKSTDGGVTYGPISAIAAPDPTFPGPMRYDAAHNLVFFGWDKRGATQASPSAINLSISRDGGTTWTMCRAASAPAAAAGFVVADNDSAGNIYLAYAEKATYHTYLVALPAASLSKCNQPIVGTTQPTVNPGFSQPVQVDREAVRTTVFPWLVAGATPGRVAVTFYGTESDGDPNAETFKASWDVYVNQSLNALDPTATFSQVKATTHPFHYDSICLNGLACDTTSPGDRSLADFFAIDYNPVSQKLLVVFDRGEKKPNESAGHVATPMSVTQTGGPSLGGGKVSNHRPVVRTSSTDPYGDALSSYSVLAPAPPPATKNEPPADFSSVTVSPQSDLTTGQTVPSGGFTVVMRLRDLTTQSLAATMASTGSTQLLWVFRFVNGYQAAAASAYYSPVGGFTFGYNDYSTGTAPCESTGPVSNEKCVVYPGDKPIQGKVDQARGIIALSVPRSYLRALSGSTGPGQRPSEVPAAEGSRFYDAAAWSLGNTSPTKAFQTFLYPLDNTPAMDFLLPGAKNGGGKGAISSGCDDNSLLVTGPAVAHAGGTVEYTITSSSGAKPDDGCRVNDVLPGDVTFVSASSGGVYDAATHTVAWSTGTVPAATVTTLKLTGQVAAGAALGSVLVDEASFDGLIFGPFARAETTVVP